MMSGTSKMPRYVLMQDQRPLGPSLTLAAEAEATVIYGFSGKPQYDAFLQQSSIALTPYPMVQRFLQRQSHLDTPQVQMVVLDAASPTQSNLRATTAQAIVDSFDRKQDTVAVSHELSLDGTSGLYRIHTLAVSTNGVVAR
jgi:hypothetical protein